LVAKLIVSFFVDPLDYFFLLVRSFAELRCFRVRSSLAGCVAMLKVIAFFIDGKHCAAFRTHIVLGNHPRAWLKLELACAPFAVFAPRRSWEFFWTFWRDQGRHFWRRVSRNIGFLLSSETAKHFHFNLMQN
jgi:hypothetical protein